MELGRGGVVGDGARTRGVVGGGARTKGVVGGGARTKGVVGDGARTRGMGCVWEVGSSVMEQRRSGYSSNFNLLNFIPTLQYWGCIEMICTLQGSCHTLGTL